MNNLRKELRRLNLALAASSRIAHETWVEAYRQKNIETSRRREFRSQLEAVENEIKQLEAERELVARAIKYETLAQSDEHDDDEPTGDIKPYSLTIESPTTMPEVQPEIVPTTNGRTIVKRRVGRPRKVPA